MLVNMAPVQRNSAVSPYFKGFRVKPDANEILVKYAQNQRTMESFAVSFQTLETLAKKTDVVVEPYGDRGVAIKEVEDFKSEKTIELLAKDEDAMTAIDKACVRLKEKLEPKEKKIRERFPGTGKLDIKG